VVDPAGRDGESSEVIDGRAAGNLCCADAFDLSVANHNSLVLERPTAPVEQRRCFEDNNLPKKYRREHQKMNERITKLS